MTRKILPIVFIFACTSFAWWFLGSTLVVRSDNADAVLQGQVNQLWGVPQGQAAPALYAPTGKTKVELESSDITVDLNLDHRRKGLLWYSTYRVEFDGHYQLTNPTDSSAEVIVVYQFPAPDGIYDDFKFVVGDDSIGQFNTAGDGMEATLSLEPGETKTVRIAYGSQGMDEWWYRFGQGVSQLNRFNLVMTTNFDKINFPEQSISPTGRVQTDSGWRLNWSYDSLISGVQIGMQMPSKLNPGPFVSRVSFFAPVSLFFFFFLIFMITTLKKIDLHPMNYFFLATGFFAFHLLLAYLVDHIDIHLAMLISSVVSVGLILSYMRLVVGWRFAMLETGISQMVYLVLFSYAFFLDGYTGLTITICSILTLFVVMQVTGRMNWNELLAVSTPPSRARPIEPPPVQ